MVKKQRDEVKNSLQAYLETRVVQPEKTKKNDDPRT